MTDQTINSNYSPYPFSKIR